MSDLEQLCLELGGLSEETGRKSFLQSAPHLVDRAVVAQLADAVRLKVRVDLPAALRLADAAIIIAEGLGDDLSIALASRAKANALWFMGQCRPALDLFDEAVRRFEKAGNQSEVGRTLSGSIQSLILLGEYSTALSTVERARRIFSESGETLRLARLEINEANIYHRQNHFAQALAAYEHAHEQLLPLQDNEGVAVAAHNMAVCRIALNDFSGALRDYQAMRSFSESHNMPLLISQADYNIAYLYYLRGQYTEALERLRIARETCRRNGDGYHLGLCDLDQSEIYLELRMIDEATEMAQSSFDRLKELGITFEAARALSNLAVAAGLRKESTRGRELFAEAKAMLVREKNQAWAFLMDLYQALMMFGQGDLETSRHLCASASEYFVSAQMPGKYAQCLLLQARTCFATGELGRGLSLCQQALVVANQLESSALLFDSHYLAGQIQEAMNESADAWRSYLASSAALETLRAGLEAEELKISFMNDKAEVYAHLARLCLSGGEQEGSEKAFLYIEQAKSRALRDLLNERMTPSASEFLEPGMDERIIELRKELNWSYRRIEREELSQEESNREVIAALREQARRQERELLRHSREMPLGTGKHPGNAEACTLQQIRDSLGKDTTLLEYFTLRDVIYAAVVTYESLDCVPLTPASRLNESARLLRFQLSKFQLGHEYVSTFKDSLFHSTQAHLVELYDLVIAPLRPLFDSRRHLVVVPCGILHTLPFHALITEGRSLIDDFTVNYAPSASIYALTAESAANHNSGSLVLGVDHEDTPFVHQEVTGVAAVLPNSQLLWGAEATESALREKGAHCRFIHVATHGHFRADSPMFSAIRLADGYLSLFDLYHMHLPAELLTLSGCGTGLNVTNSAEESLGLAGGLLHAGSRSLLLSLWDVDDHSTAQFMALFYSHFMNGCSKTNAVKAAMIDHRQSYPHPYYWAPFKLLGSALN